MNRITDLGEKKLIDRLLNKSRTSRVKSLFFDENTLKSLSDDAALLDIGDKYLVACSDMLMKSSHFPDEMTPYQIGQKIITVNVSDLAAMGSDAVGIIVAMGLPREMLVSDFDMIVEGILDGCEKYDMALIGGDTNESRELTLCGTCLGVVRKENVLMKSGAMPGDILAVTGPLGLAAAGFRILINDLGDGDLGIDVRKKVIKHALEPEAKLEQGISLAKSGYVSSATDITDGLLSEINELVQSNSNEVGIAINQMDIPIPREVFEVAKIAGEDPFEMATTYGEDFELLITVDPSYFDDLNSQLPIHKIGLVDSTGTIKMIDKAGNTNIITPRGYEHLK